MFIAANAEKIAAQESEPLVVSLIKEKKEETGSLFSLNNNDILVTALVPQSDGYLMRLFNAGGIPEKLEIIWKDNPAEAFFSDLDGKKTAGYTPGIMIPAWGLRTLKVRR